MGELVIVTGPPGSGKSTVCDDFAEAELPARHLIADTGATPGDLADIILNGLNDGGFLWKVAH